MDYEFNYDSKLRDFPTTYELHILDVSINLWPLSMSLAPKFTKLRFIDGICATCSAKYIASKDVA